MKFPKLKNPSILSPMSGVTDVAFRTLCKNYGVGMTVTEFVSSAAVVRGNTATTRLLEVDKSEKPVCVQLFGNNTEEVVAAAKLLQKQFDVIDINCGCPAYKVIKTGAGSELLKEPTKVYELVSKLTNAINKPVTVKIRTGINEKKINAVEVALKAQAAGAAAVAVHGRTQAQGYSGNADWNVIGKVKEALDIPVIGNGDVFSPENFKQRMDETGVDGIMVARGAMTNPHIFAQINQYLKKGSYEKKSKKEQFFEYLKLAKEKNIHFLKIKSHAMSFSKGIEGGSEIRREFSKIHDLARIEEIFQKL